MSSADLGKNDHSDCGSSFFKSKFHCFDATIIVAGFIIDVCMYIPERALPFQYQLPWHKTCFGSRIVPYSAKES